MSLITSSKPKKVLVVDDDGAIVNLVDHALRLHHYEAITATHWTDALEDLEHESPDLMLLDLSMPTIDGSSILEFIRERGNHIPVIIISGHLNGEIASELRKLKVEALISKPFNIHQIIGEIERVIGPPGKGTVSDENDSAQVLDDEEPEGDFSQTGDPQVQLKTPVPGEIADPLLAEPDTSDHPKQDEETARPPEGKKARIRKLRKHKQSKTAKRRNRLYIAVTCVICVILATSLVITQEFFAKNAVEFNKQAKKSMAEQLLRQIERAQERQTRNVVKDNKSRK
jgi:CheY-like chemotaxis protein